jgi:hypothetical protein
MEKNKDMDQIIDVESYAKEGKNIPTGPKVKYQIRIDGERYIMDKQLVTGRELLLKAEKIPPEQYRLDQKLHGGATKKIGLSNVVDLAAPGVERFLTLPLDNTEG